MLSLRLRGLRERRLALIDVPRLHARRLPTAQLREQARPTGTVRQFVTNRHQAPALVEVGDQSGLCQLHAVRGGRANLDADAPGVPSRRPSPEVALCAALDSGLSSRTPPANCGESGSTEDNSGKSLKHQNRRRTR